MDITKERAKNIVYHQLDADIENLIREEASRENTCVDFEFYMYPVAVKQRMLSEIKSKGFSVELIDEYTQCYRIKWE